MAQESDKEFVPWFKEFVDKVEGGYTRKSWVPQDLEAWVAEIDAGHQEIRNLLGGTRKTFKVEESEGQGAAVDRNFESVLGRKYERMAPTGNC